MAQINLDEIDNEPMTPDRVENILEWLAEEEYASFDHTIVRLIWRCGFQSYALHALDLDDYDAENQRLHVVNRSDTGTKLVGRHYSERVIALNDETCEILDTYIEENRHDVTDDHGREPLLTTEFGRPARTTFRRHVYRCTQPCQETGECPHDVPLDDCEARGYGGKMGTCPSAATPVDLRNTMIDHWADDLGLGNVVEDRAAEHGVSSGYIDYNSWDDTERAEIRRAYIEGIDLEDILEFEFLSPLHARESLLAIFRSQLGHEINDTPLDKETLYFVSWCARRDIKMMNELTPSLVDDYLDWRESIEEGSVSPSARIFHSLVVRNMILINDWHEFKSAEMESPTLASEPCHEPTREIDGREINVGGGEQYEIDLNLRPRMDESRR